MNFLEFMGLVFIVLLVFCALMQITGILNISIELEDEKR